MKKLIISIPVIIMAIGVLMTGCKKSEIDGNYYDPNGSVEATIPTLYSGLLFNERVLPRYWGLFTLQVPVFGTYTQTAGYTQGDKIYEQPPNYTQDRWNYYYTNTIARYREIEKYYGKLVTDADKTGYLLFLETARIFVYDQTAQMVDMWGDIPFSKAGQLNATGNIVLAGYDKQADIYAFILSELKRISDYLAAVKPESVYQSQFSYFDYINGGSVTLWRKYCNSLLVRLAMRTSYKDETAAKAIVQTILSNPTQYPLINTASESIKIQPKNDLSTLTVKGDIKNGLLAIPFPGSKMIDDIMAPANDPRLPILFSSNKRGEYHGVPNTWNSTRVSDSVRTNYFSRWDSTTFSENNVFPGIIMTAAEVSFLKAEAYERWGNGDAKAAYETGIRQSIQFYHSVNQNNINEGFAEDYEDMPTELAITAYLANPIVAYGINNLEKIATQKWIDFGVIQAHQAWAEYRRTKLPVLTFPTDISSVISPTPPSRLLYPGNEVSLNAENYSAVKSADKVSTKIFWDVK